MAEEEQPDDTQKTEEPSQKKLEEARKKGQVALSREVNNWLMLLAATILVAAGGPWIMSSLMEVLQAYMEHAADFPPVPGGFGIVLGGGLLKVLGILTLPLLALMLAAFIGPFVQVGPVFAPEVVKPDISKISPFQGFRRLFSMRSLMEFVKGLLKLGAIGAVGFIALKPYFGTIDHMVGMPVALLLREIMILFVRLMTGVLVALMIIAVADLAYQRWEFYKKMRMTKQEQKEEYRQAEGDPQIKSRLRQLRSQRARQRMIQSVPQADVVITNPTHFAIALKYNPDEMEAPKCLAKGMDDVALRIREVAKESGVEIVENPPLARILYEAVDIDETIPQEHYKAVAEVISFVFRKQGKLRPKPA